MSSLWRTAARKSAFWPLCALVVLSVCLVNPVGDFPLNDDWAYAKNVEEFVESGRYAGEHMILAVGQTLWGAAFTVAFGFDYSVLRLSTLLLALLTLWLTARCAMALGASRGVALLGAAVLWANPIFLNLSYTFMSEVHFLAPISVAALFYLRALRSGRERDIALGSVLAVIATSTRQFGVFLPLAYAVTAVLFWLRGTRSLSAGPIAAFLLPWVLGLATYFAVPGLDDRPPPTTNWSAVPFGYALQTTWQETTKKLVYLGFFLLPLSAVRLIQAARGRAGWTTPQLVALPWILIFILPGIMLFPDSTHILIKPLPFLGNILYDVGTGPLTLRDTYLMRMPRPVTAGGWWWIPTIFSVVSAAVVCADVVPDLYRRLVTWARTSRDGATREPPDAHLMQSVFALLWGVLFLCAPYHLVMGPGTFDRYILPAVQPFLILLAAGAGRRVPRRVHAAGLVLWGLLFFFSLACVQDYMAWNRARWTAIETLEARPGVEASQIDAGYEYNGVKTREEFIRRTGAGPHDWGPKGFWVLGDTYAVSFNPRAGYAEIGRVPYFSWLGMKKRHLLLLERGG